MARFHRTFPDPRMKTDSVPFLKSCLAALIMAFMQLPMSSPVQAEPDNPKLRNERCIRCHGKEDYSRKGTDGQQRALHVNAEQYLQSIHGGQDCVSCHRDIVKIPHRKGIDRNVGCVKCHLDSWEEAQRGDIGQEHDRLRVVVEQIETYMNSVHARPNIEDQSRTNATCYDCHDAHYMTSVSSAEDPQNKLKNPYVCGNCHTDELDTYMTSVHGKEIGMGNTATAVCSDCHSAHNVERADIVSGRLAITAQCGNCHESMLESYLQTYHGKITQLGYGETAKCYDCHGSHGIKRVTNLNRWCITAIAWRPARVAMKTRRPVTSRSSRMARPTILQSIPTMWIASKGMIGLLLGTFSFFWLHSALWFYREYQDRKHGQDRPHIRIDELDLPAGKTHFRRFTKWWRLAHLVGALSIMLLALTGLTVLFSGSSWAPYVMNVLGGPVATGYLHRIGAIGFMGVFFVHMIYFAYHIGRNWKTFDWFGPNSLVPNWNDFDDAIAMFRWFFGLGPRPLLDHYSYWEKFDYWAPFWGMTIIGVSGMMMWFPAVTATYLPGWVFNVATIVHGEEAILAVVFLFTVHFFNNHFRPDKFPLDTTMFTGRVPLEHYRHEHRREYDRLVASGELEKYLVDAPSEPMARGSSILGTVLIVIGLTLLMLVALGFLGI